MIVKTEFPAWKTRGGSSIKYGPPRLTQFVVVAIVVPLPPPWTRFALKRLKYSRHAQLLPFLCLRILTYLRLLTPGNASRRTTPETFPEIGSRRIFFCLAYTAKIRVVHGGGGRNRCEYLKRGGSCWSGVREEVIGFRWLPNYGGSVVMHSCRVSG